MIQSNFAERNLQRLFPLPAVIFVAMLMVFPVLYTSYLSFTNWNLTSGMPATFVGLSSYVRVLTEPRFLNALAQDVRVHRSSRSRSRAFSASPPP